jgi:hypothetical protein
MMVKLVCLGPMMEPPKGAGLNSTRVTSMGEKSGANMAISATYVFNKKSLEGNSQAPVGAQTAPIRTRSENDNIQ